MTPLLLLALTCLRVGAVVFGGGMVFIPLMEADVVTRYHWLTHQEFLDAVAMGQMTPGPLLVTVTFIGYKVAGLLGAIVATLCVFLPSFVMTVVAAKYVSRLQANPRLKDFLWGVRASVVGLLLAATVSLAQGGLVSPWQVGLAVVAGAALFWRKLDGGFVIVGCGVVGLLVAQVTTWPG